MLSKASHTFAACLLAAAALPTQAAERSLMDGTWSYRPRGTQCTEQYYFRSDGILMVTSGKEVTESEYTLSSEPNANGLYVFESTVVQTNGKLDCHGNKTAVGTQLSSFIRVHANGDRAYLCRDAASRVCIGPLVRLKGLGA